MDKTYWNGRRRAALAMARAAESSEARLIHYELAGRYGIRATHGLSFLLPNKGPATPGEREALRAPAPGRGLELPKHALPPPGRRSAEGGR